MFAVNIDPYINQVKKRINLTTDYMNNVAKIDNSKKDLYNKSANIAISNINKIAKNSDKSYAYNIIQKLYSGMIDLSNQIISPNPIINTADADKYVSYNTPEFISADDALNYFGRLDGVNYVDYMHDIRDNKLGYAADDELKKKQEEIDKLTNENEILSNVMKEYENKLKNVDLKTDEKNKEHKEHKEQITYNRRLTERNTQLQSEIDDLKKTKNENNARLKTLQIELENIDEKNRVLINENNILREEKARLGIENTHLGEEKARLGIENIHLGEENIHLGEENIHLAEENIHLMEEQKRLEDTIQELTEEINKNREELDNLQKTHKKLDNLQKIYDELIIQYNKLKDKLQKIAENKNADNSDDEFYDFEKDPLNGDIPCDAKVEDLNKTIAEMKETIHNLEVQIGNLVSTYEGKNEELKKLHAELREYKIDIEHLNRYSDIDKYTDDTTGYDALEKKIKNYEEQIKRIKSTTDHINELEKELEALKTQLDEKYNEGITEGRKLRSADDEKIISRQQTRIDNLLNENTKLQGKISKLEDDIKLLDTNNRKSVENLTADIEDKELKIAQYGRENKKLTDKINEMKENDGSQRLSYESKISANEDQIIKNKREMGDILQKIKILEQNNADMIDLIISLNNIIVDKSNMLHTAELYIHQLMSNGDISQEPDLSYVHNHLSNINEYNDTNKTDEKSKMIYPENNDYINKIDNLIKHNTSNNLDTYYENSIYDLNKHHQYDENFTYNLLVYDIEVCMKYYAKARNVNDVFSIIYYEKIQKCISSLIEKYNIIISDTLFKECIINTLKEKNENDDLIDEIIKNIYDIDRSETTYIINDRNNTDTAYIIISKSKHNIPKEFIGDLNDETARDTLSSIDNLLFFYYLLSKRISDYVYKIQKKDLDIINAIDNEELKNTEIIILLNNDNNYNNELEIKLVDSLYQNCSFVMDSLNKKNIERILEFITYLIEKLTDKYKENLLDNTYLDLLSKLTKLNDIIADNIDNIKESVDGVDGVDDINTDADDINTDADDKNANDIADIFKKYKEENKNNVRRKGYTPRQNTQNIQQLNTNSLDLASSNVKNKIKRLRILHNILYVDYTFVNYSRCIDLLFTYNKIISKLLIEHNINILDIINAKLILPHPKIFNEQLNEYLNEEGAIVYEDLKKKIDNEEHNVHKKYSNFIKKTIYFYDTAYIQIPIYISKNLPIESLEINLIYFSNELHKNITMWGLENTSICDYYKYLIDFKLNKYLAIRKEFMDSINIKSEYKLYSPMNNNIITLQYKNINDERLLFTADNIFKNLYNDGVKINIKNINGEYIYINGYKNRSNEYLIIKYHENEINEEKKKLIPYEDYKYFLQISKKKITDDRISNEQIIDDTKKQNEQNIIDDTKKQNEQSVVEQNTPDTRVSKSKQRHRRNNFRNIGRPQTPLMMQPDKINTMERPVSTASTTDDGDFSETERENTENTDNKKSSNIPNLPISGGLLFTTPNFNHNINFNAIFNIFCMICVFLLIYYIYKTQFVCTAMYSINIYSK